MYFRKSYPIRFSHWTKKMDLPNFVPCKYIANIWKLSSKYGAMKVNVTSHIKKQGVQITRPRETLCKAIFSSVWDIRPQISAKYELLYWGNLYVGFQLQLIVFLQVFSCVYTIEKYALWIFMSFYIEIFLNRYDMLCSYIQVRLTLRIKTIFFFTHLCSPRKLAAQAINQNSN